MTGAVRAVDVVFETGPVAYVSPSDYCAFKSTLRNTYAYII